jgi:hypothetical protein
MHPVLVRVLSGLQLFIADGEAASEFTVKAKLAWPCCKKVSACRALVIGKLVWQGRRAQPGLAGCDAEDESDGGARP